jgi:hypothetical protein
MWNWYLTGMVTGWLFVSLLLNVALVYGWIEILRRPRLISAKVYDYEQDDNSGPIRRSA